MFKTWVSITAVLFVVLFSINANAGSRKKLGGAGPRAPAPAPGNNGHHGKSGFTGGDDWEPEIAADGSGHVYVVWTHFPGNTVIDPSAGAAKAVYIQVSSDGGTTFAAQHVVSALPGGLSYTDQGDSTVEVDPANGAVYVTFLAWGLSANKTDTWVARSNDFGATFPQVRKVNSAATNTDHPWSAVRNGNVYTTYAQGADHWLSRSADGGNTWTETRVLTAGGVGFPEGSVVDAAGNAWFFWADCRNGSCSGTTAVDFRVSRTLAGTSTTAFAVIGNAPQGPACPFKKCGFAYFSPQGDIALDAGGNLYAVWQDGDAHTTAKSPTRVNLSRCAAGSDCTQAANWAFVSRVDDKTASGCAGSACYALFPRIEGAGANAITVSWMDDRKGSPLNHTNGWNVWMRSSTTGGTSWSTAGRQVSSYDSARPESQPNGFLFPYGDFSGLTFLSPSGNAGLVWGEGVNYLGGASSPGHVIYRPMTP